MDAYVTCTDSKIVWKGPSFKRPYFGAQNWDFYDLNQPLWLSKIIWKLISPIEAVWFIAILFLETDFYASLQILVHQTYVKHQNLISLYCAVYWLWL